MRTGRFLFLALLLLCLAGSAAAETADPDPSVPAGFSEEAKAAGTDKLQKAVPSDAREILGDSDLQDSQMGQKGLSSLRKALSEGFTKSIRSALRQAAALLTVLLLCTAATAGMHESSVRDAVTLAGTAAVAVLAVGDAGSLLSQGSAVLRELSEFSKAVLPVMCSAAVSAGAAVSGAAKYAASAMFMDLLLTVGVDFVLPLVSLYLAAALANAVLPKDTLGGVANFLKWVCTTALTLLVLAFTAYLAVTGIVSGKTDEFTAKAAKTAISAALPVVGGTLSDATETIVAGAGLVRNAVGVFGLLAVSAICLGPFLAVGAKYLVYKGVAALSQAICDKRMADMIDQIGTAFGLILGLVGAGGAILFLSLVASMKAVGG